MDLKHSNGNMFTSISKLNNKEDSIELLNMIGNLAKPNFLDKSSPQQVFKEVKQ